MEIARAFSIHFICVQLLFHATHSPSQLVCFLFRFSRFPLLLLLLPLLLLLSLLLHNLMLSVLLSFIQYVQLLFGGTVTYQYIVCLYAYACGWICACVHKNHLNHKIYDFCILSRASVPFRSVSFHWICRMFVFFHEFIYVCMRVISFRFEMHTSFSFCSLVSFFHPLNHCQLIGNSVCLSYHSCNHHHRYHYQSNIPTN